MGTKKAATKMGLEKEETAKRGVKRGRKEAESSSSKGSNTHPFCQTNLKRWKRGRYIPIYLTLMDEVVSKTISFDVPMWSTRFWVSFTEEFNKRVKESITKPKRLARFEDFEIEDVMNYGEGLRQTYKENEKEAVMLKDFHLYEKAFKHCDRIIPPSFSNSSKCTRVTRCLCCFPFTDSCRSRGSMETISSSRNGELLDALDQLSHLRRSGKLRLKHVKKAMTSFIENAEMPFFWLNLSLKDQVKLIKKHL